ncbi:MAG: hypothetical protein ABJN62_01490 [Halioglobus sp.]
MHKKIPLALLFLVSVVCQASELSFSKPTAFAFGASLEQVKTDLEHLCRSIQVKKIAPITSPLAKTSQNQIDCSGFLYAGKERKVELVFLDDQLDIVWILFPEDEKNIFLKGFEATYGEPSMVVEYGAIFLQSNAAIRNSPSEVLFASDRQVKMMLNQLKQQQEKHSD